MPPPYNYKISHITPTADEADKQWTCHPHTFAKFHTSRLLLIKLINSGHAIPHRTTKLHTSPLLLTKQINSGHATPHMTTKPYTSRLMPADIISNVRSIRHTNVRYLKEIYWIHNLSIRQLYVYFKCYQKQPNKNGRTSNTKEKILRYYDRTMWISKLLSKFYKWNVVLYMPNADKSARRQAELELWKQRTLRQVLDELFS